MPCSTLFVFLTNKAWSSSNIPAFLAHELPLGGENFLIVYSIIAMYVG